MRPRLYRNDGQLKDILRRRVGVEFCAQDVFFGNNFFGLQFESFFGYGSVYINPP